MSEGGTRLLLACSSCCLVLLDKVSPPLMKQSQLHIKPQVASQFHFQSGLVNLCHSQTLVRQSPGGKHAAAPGTNHHHHHSIQAAAGRLFSYQWQLSLCPIHSTLLLRLFKYSFQFVWQTVNGERALDIFQYNLTHTCQDFELCVAQCRLCDCLVLGSDYSLVALSEDVLCLPSSSSSLSVSVPCCLPV